jgi:hypothetical protein
MSTTRTIGLDDVPGRSVILTCNDIHIPYHDDRACRLMVECAEDNGCTHVIPNGDILDSGIGSGIPSKKAIDTIAWGTLAKSAHQGKWLTDWFRTKRCWYLLGNHEKWIERFIQQDPAMAALQPMDLFGLPRDGEGWDVLPSNSRLRLDTYVWEHGHGIFPRGTSANPGGRIKAVAPQQTTFIGHLHRDFVTSWTTQNHKGIEVTFQAHGAGHISQTASHEDYAGGYPGWQSSFLMQYCYEVKNRPRITTDHVLIHRDGKDRPIFEYRGKVYR